MAAGDVTVSGAFGLDDTAGIKAFVESVTVATAGDLVATYRDDATGGVYIIAQEGAGA